MAKIGELTAAQRKEGAELLKAANAALWALEKWAQDAVAGQPAADHGAHRRRGYVVYNPRAQPQGAVAGGMQQCHVTLHPESRRSHRTIRPSSFGMRKCARRRRCPPQLFGSLREAHYAINAAIELLAMQKKTAITMSLPALDRGRRAVHDPRGEFYIGAHSRRD